VISSQRQGRCSTARCSLRPTSTQAGSASSRRRCRSMTSTLVEVPQKEASWWGALAAYGWLTAAACSSGSITSSTISMIT